MYGTFTLYGTSFQRFLLTCHVPFSCSYYPVYAIIHIRFGLFPVRSPLLRESLLFSLPAGTKMFQFPAFALHKKMEYRSFQTVGCPIRRLTYQRIFAPTRHFSQLITSFFASVSQGIHHAPLFTSSLHMIPDYYNNIITPTTYALILSVVISFLAIFYSLSCVNMSKISFTYVTTDKRQYKKPKGSYEYSP